MPAYMVEASRDAATRRIEGVDTAIVFAADASTAKKVCQARWGGDSDAVWNGATVTEIVAGTNWIGWVFRAQVFHPSTGATVVDLSLTATGAGQDTIDEIGAALVTALNALSNVAASAYNSTTQVLDVTGIADGFGDHRLVFTIKPPLAQNEGDVNISDLVGTIVHLGAAGAVLSVVLPADATVVPIVRQLSKRV